MKCEVCNKDIFYELSFKDLFSFRFICKECANILDIKETLIPIDYGYFIHYVYFVLSSDISDEMHEYLNQKIIDFIFKNKDKMIFIYDEDDIDLYNFLNFKEDIYIIKKEYIELENLYEVL